MWTSAIAENGFLKVCRLTGFGYRQTEHQLAAYTDELLRQVADSVNLLPNGPQQLTHDEVYQIFMECL